MSRTRTTASLRRPTVWIGRSENTAGISAASDLDLGRLELVDGVGDRRRPRRRLGGLDLGGRSSTASISGSGVVTGCPSSTDSVRSARSLSDLGDLERQRAAARRAGVAARRRP